MRGIFSILLIVFVSSLANAVDFGNKDTVKDKDDILKYPANPGNLGKTHTYKLVDLQKAEIVVSAGDVILVIEECKPTEAKEFKAVSNNPHIKVRAVAMDGELRIVITADMQGDATVSWYFKVMGVNSGYKRLKIKIQ
jgi:hypothetical protein